MCAEMQVYIQHYDHPTHHHQLIYSYHCDADIGAIYHRAGIAVPIEYVLNGSKELSAGKCSIPLSPPPPFSNTLIRFHQASFQGRLEQ